MKKIIVAALAATLAVSAHAATYVGSWQVADGNTWTTTPPALSGTATAALLFGGTASKYQISTIDANPANIDHKSWVSVWHANLFSDCTGYPCGRKVADNIVTSTGGLYANPGDESAYVADWANGPQFRNYAFAVGVPEPASWALMIAGFGLVGASLRRHRSGYATA